VSQVFLSPDNDPEMAQAMLRARTTFRFFWRELSWERRRIIPGLDLACVKVPFSDPPDPTGATDSPQVEQMWIDQVEFDGRQVTGILINTPKWLKSVKDGDSNQVPLSGISDWMYVVAGRVYGGFTVHALRARMSRSERAAHDRAWGLEFGDPLAPEVVPKKWFECKGKKSVWQLLTGSAPSLPDHWEELEHPMADNMVESLEKHVAQHPEQLANVDERGFTLLHQLALAGATKCCDTLLRLGADPRAITHEGFSAMQLAEILGWSSTAEIFRSRGAM
jgi:uncharacterized protein YegJ (DUF2314 family)